MAENAYLNSIPRQTYFKMKFLTASVTSIEEAFFFQAMKLYCLFNADYRPLYFLRFRTSLGPAMTAG